VVVGRFHAETVQPVQVWKMKLDVDFRGVCRKGVDSIKCNRCSQCVHGGCSGVSIKMNVAGILCKRYVDGQLFREVVAMNEIMMCSLDKFECVDKFCYLGDLIGTGGGAEEA